MKIMVTGQSGMLGWEVRKAIKRMGHEAIIDKELDITKMTELKGDPEIVINCAGWVPQRRPPPSPSGFMLVNGYGPWRLAGFCDRIGARLVHVSTDCVFDGTDYKPDGPPHYENDPPRPITPYGYSKLAGEIQEMPHLTVRTSFVGRGERGLITELKQCAEKNEPYKASHHLHWTGHTTRFVAEILVMLAGRSITGILHIPGEAFTRNELANLLNKTLNIGADILPAYRPEIDRRLGSKQWKKIRLPDLPSFERQLEWLSRSQ